jgi:hypothetical protein
MDTVQNALLALFEEQQVFPHLLSLHYPHVLAGILDTWESPKASTLCFDELMLAEPRRCTTSSTRVRLVLRSTSGAARRNSRAPEQRRPTTMPKRRCGA